MDKVNNKSFTGKLISYRALEKYYTQNIEPDVIIKTYTENNIKYLDIELKPKKNSAIPYTDGSNIYKLYKNCDDNSISWKAFTVNTEDAIIIISNYVILEELKEGKKLYLFRDYYHQMYFNNFLEILLPDEFSL